MSAEVNSLRFLIAYVAVEVGNGPLTRAAVKEWFHVNALHIEYCGAD